MWGRPSRLREASAWSRQSSRIACERRRTGRLRAESPVPRRYASSSNDRDIPGRSRLLHSVELHERLAVGENRLQLVVLRRRKVALRLDDVEVGRHADGELAVFGVELLLGQVARRLRRLHALGSVLDVDGSIV